MHDLQSGERLADREAVMQALGIEVGDGVMVGRVTAGARVAGWLAPDGLGQQAYMWDTAEPADNRPPNTWTPGARLSLPLTSAPCVSIETAVRVLGGVHLGARAVVGDPVPGARPPVGVGFYREWLEATAELRPGGSITLAFDGASGPPQCATRATLVQARRL